MCGELKQGHTHPLAKDEYEEISKICNARGQVMMEPCSYSFAASGNIYSLCLDCQMKVDGIAENVIRAKGRMKFE